MIRILYADGETRQSIFGEQQETAAPSEAVAGIIKRVRDEGDVAVLDLTERYDGCRLETLLVSPQEMDEAMAAVPPEFVDIMRAASRNIRAYHERQVRHGFLLDDREGLTTGQRMVPIERVGLYVPGGTAAYPSSVLMNAIPAMIAGCPRIIMATPPGPDGRINAGILAAAQVAGITEVYKMGGAQAVAAMAYGTNSVPRVDKIVGPGNAWVAEAKRQVYGQVGIDMIAGPSEILIIADGASDPRHVAADLLSQAEHDRQAAAVLVTESEALAQAVQQEVERQLVTLPRQDIARASIERNGKIIVTRDMMEAVDMANRIAPEHLELCVDAPFDLLPRIVNAGSVFLGRWCPEAMGDYFAGPNHTLPTSGTARFSSALSVDDFVKKIQFSYYTKEALRREKDGVALFARMEGLEAHARSALSRFEGEEQP